MNQKLKTTVYIAGLALVTLLAITIIVIAEVRNTNGSDATVGKDKHKHINMGLVSNLLEKNPYSPLKDLKSYIHYEAEKDLEYGCEDTYYTVKKVSNNQSQVVVDYGCTSPSASMYAIYRNDNWIFISPTNQFDELGIPDCVYVEKNYINKDISPVCQSIVDNVRQYFVR